MKTTFKIGFAAIIAVSTVLFSCGKYEEGPKINLASKKSRMVNTWTLTKYIYNGLEQHTSVDSVVIDYKEDNSYSETITGGMLGPLTVIGTWNFSSDKKSVIRTETNSTTPTTETILRLTSDELWVKKMVGSNTNEFHYEPN